MKLGSFDGSVIGDKAAKKAAKHLGKGYIRHDGPGQPRIVESPLKLAGSPDMTWTQLEGREALDALRRSNDEQWALLPRSPDRSSARGCWTHSPPRRAMFRRRLAGLYDRGQASQGDGEHGL